MASNTIEHRGMIYTIDTRTGWVIQEDPDLPGVIVAKFSFVEFMSHRNSKDATELANKIRLISGVGEKKLAAWMEMAGFKPGWIPVE